MRKRPREDLVAEFRPSFEDETVYLSHDGCKSAEIFSSQLKEQEMLCFMDLFDSVAIAQNVIGKYLKEFERSSHKFWFPEHWYFTLSIVTQIYEHTPCMISEGTLKRIIEYHPNFVEYLITEIGILNKDQFNFICQPFVFEKISEDLQAEIWVLFRHEYFEKFCAIHKETVRILPSNMDLQKKLKELIGMSSYYYGDYTMRLCKIGKGIPFYVDTHGDYSKQLPCRYFGENTLWWWTKRRVFPQDCDLESQINRLDLIPFADVKFQCKVEEYRKYIWMFHGDCVIHSFTPSFRKFLCYVLGNQFALHRRFSKLRHPRMEYNMRFYFDK